MINKWKLNNFKSIGNEQEFTFRPLTIFTGANSSGKSTVLQSILLITQTLQDPISSRSIVLNGGIKKFGSYNDIVNERDIKKNITFGFELSDYNDIQQTEEPFWDFDFAYKIKCEFTIASNKPKNVEEDLHPFLDKAIVSYNEDKKFTISKTKKSSLKKSNNILTKIQKKVDDSILQYSIKEYGHYQGWGYSSDVKGKNLGVSLQHFLPESVYEYVNQKDLLKNWLNKLLDGTQRNRHFELTLLEKVITDEAIRIAKEIYEKRPDLSERNSYISRFIESKELKDFGNIFKRLNIDNKDKKIYINRLNNVIDLQPEQYFLREVPPRFRDGIMKLNNLFQNKIKYLGPLREEPKALYPLANGLSSTDVGLKGENTAAVFENNKNKKISYVEPTDIVNIDCKPLRKQEDTLEVAIGKWLKYLGVANDIITDDKGKFGHDMKIITDKKNRQQDLTHVGVGVSQVLPILVMSLLAEEEDVLIMEQPELHLHPKVQTRLADFFITMNALKKQCLIETHSEYLINRLRYFVAIANDSKIADDTMIYFVEKDKQTGCSKYREVTINKYGVIEDWPDGFFDESERIASEILKAGMEKRRKEEYDDYEEE